MTKTTKSLLPVIFVSLVAASLGSNQASAQQTLKNADKTFTTHPAHSNVSSEETSTNATRFSTGRINGSAQDVSQQTAKVLPRFRAEMLGHELSRTLHDRLQPLYTEYGIAAGSPVMIGLMSGQKEITFSDISGPSQTSPRDGFIKIDDQSSLGLRSLDYPSILINGLQPVSPDFMQLNSCDTISISGKASFGLVGQGTSIINLKKDEIVIASDEKIQTGLGSYTHDFEFDEPLDTGGYTLTQHVVPFNKTGWLGDGISNFWFPVANTANCRKDVSYQAHVKGNAWRSWVSNGISAGTTGESRRMEALKVKLLGDAHPSMKICYSAHVRNRGWSSEVCDGQMAGTTGENRRMEGVRIRLLNAPTGCSVQYRSHVKRDGWQSWVSNGATSGTTNKRMEDLQIRLTSQCRP